jgi:hypothetical protein
MTGRIVILPHGSRRACRAGTKLARRGQVESSIKPNPARLSLANLNPAAKNFCRAGKRAESTASYQ